MIKIRIADWKKPSTKIVVVVFSALFILSGYFIIYINFNFINLAETKTLDRLQAISKTVAMQIHGEDHLYLTRKYTKPGQITSNEQDSIYYKIWNVLHHAATTNHMKAEIATLYLDKKDNQFYYIANSLDSPYVRDLYKNAHHEFREDYQTGNVIPQYEDEFGTWLTAFSPLHDSTGKVAGIVEVDEDFSEFIRDARKGLYKNLLLSIGMFCITVIVLLRYIRVILVAEEESKKLIEASNLIISQKNKDILDSINYARRIQMAILAPKEEVYSVFKDAFILYKPKDIVSGDFYYFTKTEVGGIIAAVDCTGHGVPGALMSMVGNDALNHITRERKIRIPGTILDLLHESITHILKQEGKQGEQKDGMDIAMLHFDWNRKIVQFAGAYRPLYFVSNGKLREFKANKFPIGNAQQERGIFTNHEIDFVKGDTFYIFTDGYADQFGGDHGKKFMMRRFQELILQINEKSMSEQERILNESIEAWKKDHEQVDDILVIGIRM